MSTSAPPNTPSSPKESNVTIFQMEHFDISPAYPRLKSANIPKWLESLYPSHPECFVCEQLLEDGIRLMGSKTICFHCRFPITVCRHCYADSSEVIELIDGITSFEETDGLPVCRKCRNEEEYGKSDDEEEGEGGSDYDGDSESEEMPKKRPTDGKDKEQQQPKKKAKTEDC